MQAFVQKLTKFCVLIIIIIIIESLWAGIVDGYFEVEQYGWNIVSGQVPSLWKIG